ncbi:hypothetical protein JHK84_043472 [Glycine max]|nr:hypothetical protein JHK86_043290 [Glycine max]KAG4957545.1 hypothetical protein JHK85_043925 [Glycine max]KAG5117359.1 hypothetical protein JHK84_043472 [Glycine max]
MRSSPPPLCRSVDSDAGVFVVILTSTSTNVDMEGSQIRQSGAARTLGVAPAMAKEHLLSAESKGLLCRDINPDGFRFYINLFLKIDRDMYFSSIHRLLAGQFSSSSVKPEKGVGNLLGQSVHNSSSVKP